MNKSRISADDGLYSRSFYVLQGYKSTCWGDKEYSESPLDLQLLVLTMYVRDGFVSTSFNSSAFSTLGHTNARIPRGIQ